MHGNLFAARQLCFTARMIQLANAVRLTGLIPSEFRGFVPKLEGDERPRIKPNGDGIVNIARNDNGHAHGWKPYYRLDESSPWGDKALRDWEDSD